MLLCLLFLILRKTTCLVCFFVRKKWYLWINLIQYVRWGSFRPLILQLFRIAGNFKFICWHLVSLRVKIEWVAGLPCSTKKLKGQMATVMWKHCKNDLPSTLDIPFQKKTKWKILTHESTKDCCICAKVSLFS